MLYLNNGTNDNRVHWGFGHAKCSTVERKLFSISRRSHPVKFFWIASHFTCDNFLIKLCWAYKENLIS